jgi:hypothetical protein
MPQQQPCLSFRLVLDPSIITPLMMESGLVRPPSKGGVKAVAVKDIARELGLSISGFRVRPVKI